MRRNVHSFLYVYLELYCMRQQYSMFVIANIIVKKRDKNFFASIAWIFHCISKLREATRHRRTHPVRSIILLLLNDRDDTLWACRYFRLVVSHYRMLSISTQCQTIEQI